MSVGNAGKRLKGAVIGYGFIAGEGHVPAYLTRARARGDVELIAVADATPARRALAQKALPNARIHADARALLKAEASRLDFVDVCTPPCDHAAIAHLALDAGLHVLCEKPLTTTPKEARALLAHAERARRVIFPCHNYKHAPVVKTISALVRSGKIGRVSSLSLQTFRNTHAKGVAEWNPDWRRMRRYSGGGIAMDHGSHTFYLTFDWMGAYPTAITAKTTRLERAFDTEDNFSATLTFPEGLASAQLTWTSGVRKVRYAVCGDEGAITADDDELCVTVRTHGTAPGAAGRPSWSVERSRVSSSWMDASHQSWFDSLFDQFARAIAEEDWVGREAREAFLCVQLIAQGYRSAREGCRELSLAGLEGLDEHAERPLRRIGAR